MWSRNWIFCFSNEQILNKPDLDSRKSIAFCKTTIITNLFAKQPAAVCDTAVGSKGHDICHKVAVADDDEEAVLQGISEISFQFMTAICEHWERALKL